MRSPQTRTTRHGAHARPKAAAPSTRARRRAEPARSEQDATRRAAELAACEAGLPAALPGGFQLARLSTNRRSGDTLYVYRRPGGGTFCANQKGVRTRLARLSAEAEPEAAPTPPPASPSETPTADASPEAVADLRSETPTCAAIALPSEVVEVGGQRGEWIDRYAHPAVIAAAVLIGAAIIVRVAVALGA